MEQTFKEKLKQNMVTTILSVVAIVAAGLTGLETTFGFVDRAVVTEAELESYTSEHIKEAHPEALRAVAAGEVKSECRWLRSEIRAVKDRIRELQSEQADPAWIAEKITELKELEAHFEERKCSTVQYI